MSREADFEVWWQAYPRKVGKLGAQREYERIRKKVGADDLLQGITRYRAAKPAYADWCHPMTFLRQGRWLDEVPDAAGVEWADVWDWQCPHQPRCPHRAACAVVTARGSQV